MPSQVPPKLQLQLSIQHKEPKAGNWLAEVKLYELSTEAAVGLSSVQFLLSCVCVCGQIEAQERSAPPCSVSYPYIRALIDAKRLLVSCPSFLPQPLLSPFIASSFLFLVSLLLHLPPPPPHSATKLLTEAWRRARLQPAGCHRLTDCVTTH